jgi:hypothetical protein
MRPALRFMASARFGNGNARRHSAPARAFRQGFGITLVGAEPNVKFPMFAAFDERGRLFVAESSGSISMPNSLRSPVNARFACSKIAMATAFFETARIFATDWSFPWDWPGATGNCL